MNSGSVYEHPGPLSKQAPNPQRVLNPQQAPWHRTNQLRILQVDLSRASAWQWKRVFYYSRSIFVSCFSKVEWFSTKERQTPKSLNCTIGPGIAVWIWKKVARYNFLVLVRYSRCLCLSLSVYVFQILYYAFSPCILCRPEFGQLRTVGADYQGPSSMSAASSFSNTCLEPRFQHCTLSSGAVWKIHTQKMHTKTTTHSNAHLGHARHNRCHMGQTLLCEFPIGAMEGICLSHLPKEKKRKRVKRVTCRHADSAWAGSSTGALEAWLEMSPFGSQWK